MKDKERVVYPKTVSLCVGEYFSRCPKDINFAIIEGTFPVYGRVIDRVERDSEHKLTLYLGLPKVPTKENVTASKETTISLYGEIDDVVVYEDDSDEFKALWLQGE